MQFQKTQLRAAIRDILWGSGMVIAFLSLLVKLLAFSIIYMASQASNFTDLLSGVGEVKVALIILAGSLLLDSVAILLNLLNRY